MEDVHHAPAVILNQGLNALKTVQVELTVILGMENVQVKMFLIN